MDSFRLRELVVDLRQAHERGESTGQQLCATCAQLVGVTSAAVMLMDEDADAGSLGRSDDVAGAVDDLQFILGEGPGIDAHRLGRPVLGPELDDPTRSDWPSFAPAAVNVGVLAAFAFPLRVGAISFGSLNLYHDSPGDLTVTQLSDAIALADLVTTEVMDLQATAELGTVADGIDTLGSVRTEVHQATGMISTQLGIGIDAALLRLRTYAYSEGRSVNAVARDVVARQIRFE